MIKKNNFFYRVVKFLFPIGPYGTRASWLLLAVRVIFGVLLMSHGIQKLSNFTVLQSGFPDPLGMGSTISLSLAIFAEVACSIGFILGAFYRLALIPMIFTMIMAFFVIHGADPFSAKELPLVYMLIFILMYIAGPGKFSLDHFVAENLYKKD